MNLEEKIKEIINAYQAGNEINEHSGGIEELTTLIQQERENAIREFVDWIQGQGHGYRVVVHMPVNQAHIQVRETYELLEQFIAERNK